MTARPSSDAPAPRPSEGAPDVPLPQLQEEHARLKATLEALPDILFVVDRDGRIYDFHTPHPERLYVPPDRFLGRKMGDLLPEPAAGIIRAAIEETAEKGHHQGGVYSLTTPAGERWFEISAAAQGDPRTPEGRIVFLARDVTDRQEAEAELEDAHAWLKATLQALPDILFVVDRAGRILDYHAPRAEMMRIPPDRFLGRTIPDVVSAAAAKILRDALRKVAEEGPQEGVVFSIPLPEGERWYEASIAAQGDPRSPDARFVAIVRDVHDRKQAEDALRESEVRFARSAEASRSYVWEVDANGLYSFISPVVKDVLGYEPGDIVGHRHFYDFHPPEGFAEFKEGAIQLFREAKPVAGFENPNVAKDGRIVWVSSSATPLFDAAGSLRGYQGVDIDVTARKQAEEALRESEVRFAQSARQSRTYLWEVDADGLYTFASPVVQDVLGYRPEDIVGRMHFYDLFPEPDREAFKQDVLEIIRRRESFRDYETPCQAKDGHVVWVITSAIPLLGADGALRGYRGSDTDVSTRKRAEEALRESEMRLRMLNDNLPGGLVYQMDTGVDGRERRLLAVSKGVERLHGVTAEEALSHQKTFYLQVVEEDQAMVAELEARAIATLTPFCAEVRCRLPSGDIRWIYVSSAPRRLPNGHLIWDGIELDVTERKQAEEALKASETRYRELFDFAVDGILLSSREGIVTDANACMCALTGRTREELVGMHIRDLLDPENTGKNPVRFDLVQQGRTVVRERKLLRPDASEAYVEMHSKMMPDGTYQSIFRDVTERKRTEEALRESETHRHAINDNLPGGFVYQIDTGEDGRRRRFTFISKGVERVQGVAVDDAMRDAMAIYGQILEEDRPLLEEREARAIATMASFSAEARVRMPSGEIQWRHFASAPRRLPNRHLVWDGIALDVTERKQAEEALRRSETKYRLLHETMRDAFASTDMKRRILETNPAFQLLTGYSKAELRGMDFRTLTPAKWHAAEAKILAEQVLAHGYSDVYQKEYLRKDGTTVPVELRTILIRDDAGKPTGMWASIRDVTARLRIEQALRQATGELERRVRERTAELEASRQALAQSEAQFRQMTGIIQEVFWLVDARTGRALYVSPAFEQIWGRPPRQDNPGVFAWIEGLHPDDQTRALQAFRRGMEAGVFDPLEVRVMRPDGSIRWIDVRGWLIRPVAGDPPRVAGVMRDVTERRRLEAELLSATEMERQRIGRDLHDSLGQSLTGIGYLAEALREDLARNNRPEAAEVETLAHLIEEAAGKSHAMARGLLLVDLKRGGLAPALQELAFRTQEMFGVACRYEGLAAVELPDADVASQLYRIAQEAATNAAKHSKGKTIDIRLANPPEGLLLSIRDTGRGLPLRKKKKGAGMGLEIMRYRARMIGATLWIDSAPNRGAPP